MTKTQAHVGIFARYRTRLWSLVVGLALAAQVAFGVHQFQHRISPDVVASDDCALCYFASGLAAGPEPVTFVPPRQVVSENIPLPAQTRPRVECDVAGFRSRAPPLPVSV